MTGEELKAALETVTAQARSMLPASAMQMLEASLARLADSGMADRVLGRGDTMPDFVLPDAFGKSFRSSEARRAGPLVLCFYRGSWCPYCSLQLQAFQAHLPELTRLGATLIAISPQKPDYSLSTQEKLGLGYPVLSDAGSALARRFGLVFKLEEPLRPLYRAMGADLPEVNGDSSFELPIPAVYVVGQGGTVRAAFVHVDYRTRTNPEAVIAALEQDAP